MDPVIIIIDRPQRRDHALKVIGKLPVEDGEVWDCVIGKHISRRSVDANRRLWALHKLAADSTGHSIEEMHELCKAKFLPRVTIKIGKEEREIYGSSAKLNKKDFRDFMDRAEEFYISELGVFLEG